jgi:hypothetical protein
MVKKCLKCKKEKESSEFSRDNRARSGLNSVCKDCYYKYKKEWYKNNPDKVKKYRERYNTYLRKWMKNRRENSPKFRLDMNFHSLVWWSLKDKKAGRKWERLAGYTIKDLMEHLEKQFDDKMTWQNYGSYWWVDHIKARSLFKYETAEDPEFKKCWSLENLQPLEKIANIKKSNSK